MWLCRILVDFGVDCRMDFWSEFKWESGVGLNIDSWMTIGWILDELGWVWAVPFDFGIMFGWIGWIVASNLRRSWIRAYVDNGWIKTTIPLIATDCWLHCWMFGMELV